MDPRHLHLLAALELRGLEAVVFFTCPFDFFCVSVVLDVVFFAEEAALFAAPLAVPFGFGGVASNAMDERFCPHVAPQKLQVLKHIPRRVRAATCHLIQEGSQLHH